ncbi:cryptochrome, DASH family [Synechococcus sp. PCC 7502]|uniref:DASH family cryptochrome n=1 Tax=Synechococcus sp. PCC 7502 TaxID=1173263 RepID=UPI00029F8443|nr:DASH family cryptochrome [Synechococcus sp. PCC 7502]AFY74906.1 cryptochrome, DASH family [Synechococcus sp. PCC 7502]
MSKKIIVWFRNDLRSHDHEALYRAIQTKAQIIPIYCIDPRHFAQTSFGFPKTGSFRAKFLLESLTDLRNKFISLGSNLIIRQGLPELVIPELAAQIQATDVYFHAEVTSEEIKVEAKLIDNLKKISIKSESFWGNTLYHPDALPFAIDRLPELFTSFRKEVEKFCTVNPCVPIPTYLPSLQDLEIGEMPTLEELGLEPAIADPRAVIKFIGGETQALERLDYYFWQSDLIATYKETRNAMLGGNYSSKFSPWLALGCISPRYIYAQIQKYEQERIKNDSTYWLVFELLWRDYFRFIATKHGNRIFKVSGLQGINLPWSEDLDKFKLWQMGKTGFPLIDANMQELAATGFMSNRGRQNVASFLTKNMGINWQLGAEWFESMLIDYDVCSNWGNWNYTAGVGNDARGFRYFNILKQSQDYDPEGKYVKHWLPALQSVPTVKVHTPWKLLEIEQERSQIRIGKDYPAPILDLDHSVKVNQKAYNSACAIGQNSKSSNKRSNFRR